ncbi:hypothetical protein BJ508DRAFT_302424 [Ascobolus immersus RN42]|uniref:Uncharacterized protein n=1 Tax=Ascobolus immersus RN42 TaxID=1160509 RepID=A0A3N4IMX7_ASCIM|nr:hypothetical protein BJ508DRAFT_302424 [Ascobolus immersus RN42]
MTIGATHGATAGAWIGVSMGWFMKHILPFKELTGPNDELYPSQYGDTNIRVFEGTDPAFDDAERQADFCFGTARHKAKKMGAVVGEICWEKGNTNLAIMICLDPNMAVLRIKAWECVSVSGRDRRLPPSPIDDENMVEARELFDYDLLEPLTDDTPDPFNLLARRRAGAPDIISIPMRYFVDIKDEARQCQKHGFVQAPEALRAINAEFDVETFLRLLQIAVHDARLSSDEGSNASSSKNYGYVLPSNHKPSVSSRRKIKKFLQKKGKPAREVENDDDDEEEEEEEEYNGSDDEYVEPSRGSTRSFMAKMVSVLTRSHSRMQDGGRDKRR